MRHAPTARPAPVARARRGLTLVEVVVGILLLTIGLGALASTSLWLVREATAARRAERAANIARSRIELLRLRPCESDAGVASHGELLEQWTVSPGTDRVIATVSVVARDNGRLREQRYQVAFPC